MVSEIFWLFEPWGRILIIVHARLLCNADVFLRCLLRRYGREWSWHSGATCFDTLVPVGIIPKRDARNREVLGSNSLSASFWLSVSHIACFGHRHMWSRGDGRDLLARLAHDKKKVCRVVTLLTCNTLVCAPTLILPQSRSVHSHTRPQNNACTFAICLWLITNMMINEYRHIVSCDSLILSRLRCDTSLFHPYTPQFLHLVYLIGTACRCCSYSSLHITRKWTATLLVSTLQCILASPFKAAWSWIQQTRPCFRRCLSDPAQHSVNHEAWRYHKRSQWSDRIGNIILNVYTGVESDCKRRL